MEKQIKSENVEALERVLKVSKETESIASATCVELKSQTDQIDRIYDKSYQVSDNIDKSERIVTGMSSFFGRVKNFFTKPKKKEEKVEIKPPQAQIPVPKPALVSQQGLKHETKPKTFEEEDKLLDEISSSVDNIKDMAISISDTLDYHNKKLDVITDVTERNTNRLNHLNYKAKKLMN
jgi:hypothetical protein